MGGVALNLGVISGFSRIETFFLHQILPKIACMDTFEIWKNSVQIGYPLSLEDCVGRLHFVFTQKWATTASLKSFEEWRKEPPETYEQLLDIHRIYRAYKADNPDNVWIESEQGVISERLVQKLEAMSYVTTNFVNDWGYAEELEEVEELTDAYPELEMKDIHARIHSLENIIFNTEFDLENPDERIFPKIKWVQANFVFSVNLTPEQFEARKEKNFRGLWDNTHLVLGNMWYEEGARSARRFEYHDDTYGTLN